jgi:hypothetical protein
MKLIGLAGPAGVGKDTIADYLVATHNFTKFSFSDALYDEVAAAFGIDKAVLYVRETKEHPMEALQYWYCNDLAFQDIMFEQLARVHKYPLDVWCSPRQVLQWWGTEYRRKQNPGYWIFKAGLVVRAYLALAKDDPETQRGGLVNCSVRFPNERVFVEMHNGEVWHVQRPNWGDALPASQRAHVAEQGLPVLPRDKVVLNNGTIEQLGTAANLLLSSQPGSMIKCAPVGPEQVTCTGCGWVHMAYTRAEAQREVDDFNAWFVQQTDETKASYGGKQSRVEDYEGCDRCGRKVFRPSKPDDAPIGCTIGPVIYDPAAEEADRRFGQPHYGHDA